MDATIPLDKRVGKASHYNGILIGLFLSADMIIKIITTLIPIQNFLVFFYLAIFMLGLIVNGFKFNVKFLLVYIVIATLFGISLMRVPDNFYTFQYFVYFSAFYFASGIIQYPISINRIFKTINIINIPYALYLYFVIFDSFESGTLLMDFTMNLSYTTLIGISSYFLSFSLLNFKQSKLFIMVNSLCVLIGLYFMFFISNNRGALVGLVILFFLILLRKLKKTAFRFVLIGIFTAVGIYVYNNLIYIVRYLHGLTVKFNLPSSFLHKSLWKLEHEDFSSGRFNLFNNAVEAFVKSPFFGNGIGDFSANNRGQYPHNLFLDVLSGLGLFAGVMVLIFSIFCFYMILKVRINNYATLGLLLFVLTFPELQFSSTLWMSPFFWAIVVLFLINPKLIDFDSKEQMSG